MAQPTAYNRAYDFAAFQALHPDTPLPAAHVEIELDAVEVTFDGILTNLALIQRDDGELANSSVHADAFDTTALALIAGGFTPRGAWVTATAYAVGDMVSVGGATYVATIAHTSGTFSTDLAADKWLVMAAVPGTSGYTAKSVAGAANVTLTDAEATNLIIKFTGVLTGNINVIFPVTARKWIIHNATTGSYTLACKTSAGTGVTVTQGNVVTIYGDGTDTLQVDGVNVQSLKSLTLAANKGLYATGAGVLALFDLTAAALTVLDDATVAAMVDTLGGASSTGTGGLARATSPTFVTPALGTPSALVLTNATGTPSAIGLANGTGLPPAGISSTTGTDAVVRATSPTLVTPTLGVAAATSINFGGTALSVYAEGTWTPELYFAAGASVTYSEQSGQYTRIGRVVIARFYLDVNSLGTASGNCGIAGLPFTIKNTGTNTEWAGALSRTNQINLTAGGAAFLRSVDNTTRFLLVENLDTGDTATVQISQLAGTYVFAGTIIYEV